MLLIAYELRNMDLLILDASGHKFSGNCERSLLEFDPIRALTLCSVRISKFALQCELLNPRDMAI